MHEKHDFHEKNIKNYMFEKQHKSDLIKTDPFKWGLEKRPEMHPTKLNGFAKSDLFYGDWKICVEGAGVEGVRTAALSADVLENARIPGAPGPVLVVEARAFSG